MVEKRLKLVGKVGERTKNTITYHGRSGNPAIHENKAGKHYIMVRAKGGGTKRLYEGSLYSENGNNNPKKKAPWSKGSSRKTITMADAKRIGERLGIKWNKFDIDQFRRGMIVELEHGLIDPKTDVTGDNLLMTGKIALAHLNELSDYYDRLEKMEAAGRK